MKEPGKAAIVLRPATAADRSAIEGMMGEFFDYLNAIEPGNGDKGRIAGLVEMALGPAPVCTALLAEHDGLPLGYLAFHFGSWEVYKTLYVVSLFVKPRERGSGIGRALMARARELGKKAGAERVIWFVWKKNTLALDFYGSLGATVFEDNHVMAWPTS